MRLIDADKLLQTYKKWIPQLTLPEDDGDKRGVETCIAVLEEAPTVDAAEVRYGYWEAYWDDDYIEYYHRCSECKSDAPAKQGTMCDQMLTTYCPNCGADMRGGQNG